MLAIETADAQVEVPQGNIGLIGQIGQNLGEAGDAYRVSWLLGMTAGYEVSRVRGFGLGATWSLAFGRYTGAAPRAPDDTVRVVDMSMGVRVRRLLGKSTPRFIVASGGATFLRLDRAVPPDNERVYLGPYAALGLDQFLRQGTLLSFEVRYGVIRYGPATLAVRLGLSFGS